MAKVNVKDVGGAANLWFTPAEYVNGETSTITTKNKHTLAFTDAEGDRFVLEGKNLKYEGDDVFSGTFTSAYIYIEGYDHAVATVRDFKFEGKLLFNPRTSDGMDNLWESLHSGRDKITGSDGADFLIGGLDDDYLSGGKGSDKLDGGAGNDILVGGSGPDVYYGGGGIDRIIGFDAVGGGTNQDYLQLDGEDYVLKQVKHDVVFAFFDGHKVILEDVKLAAITEDDLLFI